MKTVTTVHTEIGYSNNLEIIAGALRERFGFDDASHVLLAVAAHVWAVVCTKSGEERTWGTVEVEQAIAACQHRLQAMTDTLNASKAKEVAV
jgi:hypothetical protein